MKRIDSNQVIEINSDETTYTINAQESINISLVFKESCNVVFFIEEAKELNIAASVNEGLSVSLFFSNESNSEVNINEDYIVNKDGELVVSYSECNEASVKRYTNMNLSEEGAKGKINSASLVNSKKNYRFIVENSARDTFGELNNYAVVLKDGNLMIDAIGKIDKGSRNSESHQTSRALSFADGQKTTILPELLIDENDVKASHAMSIGRMDDEQLYYLMSRGLSVEQCTSLISAGYLYPIFENISDNELKDRLKNELERKLASL